MKYRVCLQGLTDSKLLSNKNFTNISAPYLISPYPNETLQDHIDKTSKPTAINEIILQDLKEKVAQF